MDKEARTLSISDNGIGMTQEELDNNLGVIARSGSLQFKQEAEKKDEVDIIGQFGVGFYSAFMVSSRVTVDTKAFGSDEAWHWESTGLDGYEITPAPRRTAAPPSPSTSRRTARTRTTASSWTSSACRIW